MKRCLVMTATLLIVLTSCGAINQQCSVVSTSLTTTAISSTPAPTATAQVTFIPPTTAPTPTFTPLPTATPISTPTALPITSLAEKGILLIWRDWAQDYLVIDLNENVPPYTVPQNPQCDPILLPGATDVVCENAAHQIYVLNVVKGSRQDLPIQNTDWFNWTSNGRFLVYGQKVEEKESIFAYDLSKHITQTLAVGLAQGETWGPLAPPTLSADGATLVVARNFAPWQSRVFEIVRGTSRYRQVGLDEPFSTADITWSPVARRFVYGATDIEQEIMPAPNYLFLVDTQSGKIRKIAAQTSKFYIGPFEWSPTGKQIAVVKAGETSEACIITVDTAEEMCPSIGFPAWSPTGEHIAFIDTAQDVIVSKPDGTGAVKLLEKIGQSVGWLFWR